jgi:phosphoribosylamine--glycine ligase
MTVLVLGSGGREHAIALAISRDPEVRAVHVAPGNPGTASFATNHPVDAADPEAVVELVRRIGADLVVVGPEAPLVAGVADAVREAGIDCFGPGREAARLEGSKAFAKEVMAAAGVPTAAAASCVNIDEVEAALDRFGAPYVVKDDGLAAGKGVVVTQDRKAAVDHAQHCLDAGHPVVIEEFLKGSEVSLFAICDGRIALPLQPAQDFKRVGNGGTGPNTGGMGAYTPLPWAPDDLVEQVGREVIRPTLAEMDAPRHPLPGPALRRPVAHRRRPPGGRVQRAIRRPGDGAAALPADDAVGPGDARCRPRRPVGLRRPGVPPRLRGRRRTGLGGISGDAGDRTPDRGCPGR